MSAAAYCTGLIMQINTHERTTKLNWHFIGTEKAWQHIRDEIGSVMTLCPPRCLWSPRAEQWCFCWAASAVDFDSSLSAAEINSRETLDVACEPAPRAAGWHYSLRKEQTQPRSEMHAFGSPEPPRPDVRLSPGLRRRRAGKRTWPTWLSGTQDPPRSRGGSVP